MEVSQLTRINIAHTGISERLSGGLFGHGAYIAEDAAKADQYAVPLETCFGWSLLCQSLSV